MQQANMRETIGRNIVYIRAAVQSYQICPLRD